MTGLRLAFSFTLALIGLFSPLAAGAQQADKTARIDYLTASLAAGDPRGREAFLQGLRDLGYIEGRNLLIEYHGGRRRDAGPGGTAARRRGARSGGLRPGLTRT